MTWIIDAPPQRPHGSQFITLGNGSILRGGCTLIALAGADILSKAASDPGSVWKLPGKVGDIASPANVQAVMRAIYDDCRLAGNCQPNGAARQVDMLNEAKRLGIPVRHVLSLQANAAPLPLQSWVTFVRKYKGYPLLWQFANGQALNDALGGGADEVGLRVHAALSYGTQTDPSNPATGGYLFLDGDSRVANQRPAVYNLATLARAQPISIIAFGYLPKPAVKPAPPPPAPIPPTPAPPMITVSPAELAQVEIRLNDALVALNVANVLVKNALTHQ